MNNIYLEAKDLSPGIILDTSSGIFEISGTSCPENAVEFYQPVLDWFDKYKNDPLEETVLDFKMEYFNSITAKLFLMIMTRLEDMFEEGHNVKIRWFYNPDEEDIEEAGIDFESILDVEFEMIELEEGSESDEQDDFFERTFDDFL